MLMYKINVFYSRYRMSFKIVAHYLMNQIRCSGDEHCSKSKVKKKNTKDEQKKTRTSTTFRGKIRCSGESHTRLDCIII